MTRNLIVPYLCVLYLEGSGDKEAINFLSNIGDVVFAVLHRCMNLLWPIMEAKLLKAEECTIGTGMYHLTGDGTRMYH